MKYTKEEIEWVVAHARGTPYKKLTEAFNERFGRNAGSKAVQGIARRHGAKNGLHGGNRNGKGVYVSKYWKSPEVREFVEKHHAGMRIKEMARVLSEMTGLEYTAQIVHGWYTRHHYKTGLPCKYEKGNVPVNKGKKIANPVPCAAWFKKGQTPYNAVPVGAEVVNCKGYRTRKIAEPNEWVYVHRYIWEQVNGPIPEGMCIIFADGNKLNCDISNLRLLMRKELGTMNKNGLFSNDAELTDIGLSIARLKIAMRRRKDKEDGHETGHSRETNPGDGTRGDNGTQVPDGEADTQVL